MIIIRCTLKKIAVVRSIWMYY